MVAAVQRQETEGHAGHFNLEGDLQLELLRPWAPPAQTAAAWTLEVLEYPELGMEAIWKIEVEDFPAFILVDDKGNDFFKQIASC